MLKIYKFLSSKRFLSTTKPISPKICIIGAGPAGFYAAQHLLKKLQNSEIDIYERLPVPFGLVRFGVAPDHPEVKNVIHTFTKTAQSPNVRFCGNVSLGKDVSLEELKNNYHVVLLTYGAEENRKLNIPGESLQNVLSARNIVGWYNGVPSDCNLKIDLSAESVAIIGQGNVAVDIARILLSPVDELKKTDITQHALDQISQSKIKKIHLIGRRGPLQAAYTIKELREMLKLSNCVTAWRQEDFKNISTEVVANLARPKKRITELMLKSVKERQEIDSANKIFNPVFLRSPLEFLGKSKVEEIVLAVNQLEGSDLFKQKAVLTQDREHLLCEMAVTSIGYTSVKADPELPLSDGESGIVKNIRGKVETGLYTAGWLGTGPMGVILTTMSNAFGVAETIVKDVQEDNLLDTSKPGFSEVEKVLERKNVQVVNWAGWEKIDQYEIGQGGKVGKPREKLFNVRKMLEIASR